MYDNSDILHIIFLKLDPSNLIKCEMVCKKWYQVINNKIWHGAVLKMYQNEIVTIVNFKLDDKIINKCEFSPPIYSKIKGYYPEINYRLIYLQTICQPFYSLAKEHFYSNIYMEQQLNKIEKVCIRSLQLIFLPTIVLPTCLLLLIFDLYQYNIHKNAWKNRKLCYCASCRKLRHDF
jgi:hypothetical protein